MNTKSVILLLLLGSTLMVSAVAVKPVVVAQRGQATVTAGSASTPLELKQAITAGSVVETDKTGKLALALAPGQMIVLGNKTKLKVVSIHDAETSQGAVVELVVGVANCYIDPKHGHSGPVFELVAGKESIKAKGTTWTTSKSEGGTVSTTVTSSAVSVSVSGGATIPVPAGAVVTSTYGADGAWSGSVVVNLVTGQVTSFAADGTSQTGPATSTQLSQASASFSAALAGAASGPGGTAESAALTALVADVNSTLAAAGLPTVGASTPTGNTTTNDPSTRDSATASPEAPGGS